MSARRGGAAGAAGGLLALAALAGCGSGQPQPAETGVVLQVQAEGGLCSRIAALQVTVRGISVAGEADGLSEDVDEGLACGRWPRRFFVAPKGGDANRTFEAVVTGVDGGGGRVVQAAVSSGFAAGRVLLLRLVLEEACEGISCEPGSFCRAGACEPAPFVDPGTLPDAAADAGAADGGKDGGAEGGMDAAMDAAMDGGTDADMDAAMDGGADADVDAAMDGGADADMDGGMDAGPVRVDSCAGQPDGTPCTCGVCVGDRCEARFVDVAVGYDHSCALDEAGQPWCWGDGARGKLGLGDTMPRTGGPQRVALPAGVALRSLQAGSQFNCGLDGEDRLWCWGDNFFGQMAEAGPGTEVPEGDRYVATPTAISVSVPAGDRIASYALSLGAVCVATETGRLYCWGRNRSGEIGNGATADAVRTPHQLSLGASLTGTARAVVREVVAGANHFFARTAAEEVWAWGENGWDQTGAVGATQVTAPTRVASLDAAYQVAGGFEYSCYVPGDGGVGVRCWGRNDDGQLGTGGTGGVRPLSMAATVGGTLASDTVARLVPGIYHGCALTSGDELHCWGLNNEGQLGRGDGVSRVAGYTMSDVRAARATIRHTCAIKRDGTLWCWGDNATGELGDGSTARRYVPTAVETVYCDPPPDG